MKFEQRRVHTNVNVTSGHPVKDFFDLFLRSLAAVFVVYLLLGWMVDVLAVRIPPTFEDKIAHALTSKFKNTPPTDLEKYATDLTNRLASLTPDLKSRPFKVYVRKHSEPNALAWPGGNIVLTSALFKAIKSENDLAMILGHELGHYSGRDHLRGLGRSLVFLTLMTVVLGVNNNLASPISGLMTDMDMNHSREQEAAADLHGLNLLQQSYGHVGGSYTFFEYMQKERKLPAWLFLRSSHPTAEARLDTLRRAAAARHWPMKEPKAFPADVSKSINDLISEKPDQPKGLTPKVNPSTDKETKYSDTKSAERP